MAFNFHRHIVLPTSMEIGEKELAADRIYKFNVDVQTILDEGYADANYLLYELSKRGSIKHLEELVHKYGADVNALSESLSFIYTFTSKGPPLFAAVEGSAVTALEWLLQHGADPNIECLAENYAFTPLWLAAENGHVRMAKLLLDHGADVNAVKSTTGRPLHSSWQCKIITRPWFHCY